MATSNPPSRAQLLAQGLLRQGISREEITRADISHLYAEIEDCPDRAGQESFATARQLLRSAPRAGIWPDEVVAVTVETRDIPELEYTILNVAETCNLRVHAFHSPASERVFHSEALEKLAAAGRLQRTCLGIRDLPARIYNALLLETRFWNALAGRRKILVFQTDSICCLQSEFSLKDFLSLDYVGANWCAQYEDFRIHGGVGGFSLRDWGKSVSALKRFDPRTWPGGEDDYFAFHLDLMGARVADEKTMTQFATKASFRFRSFGAHQVRLLPPDEHKELLAYCPEIAGALGWRQDA